MTPEEIVRVLQAGATALRDDYAVSALWIFGPAARPESGPVNEVDLLVALSRPLDVTAFVALRRRLEAMLGGLRVEPVLRPSALPDGMGDVLSDARQVF